MTQTTASTRIVELPQPQFPMLTRFISNALFPERDGRGALDAEPITWTVSLAHPLVPDMKIVRMFVDRGGVEVYSVSADGSKGMRNLIPMSWVRLIEEAMPLDVFVDELAASESDEGDEGDDPEDSGEPELDPEAPSPTPVNGHVAS